MKESLLKINLKLHLRELSMHIAASEPNQHTYQDFAINCMRIENGIQFFKHPGT